MSARWLVQMTADSSHRPPLTPKKGDFLLWPHGKRDYLCRVLQYNPTSSVVKVQFYNNEADNGMLEKVQPVWMHPEKQSDEVYCGETKRKKKFPAYVPRTTELHIDGFYQIEVTSKLQSQPGTSKFSKVTMPRHLKAGVRKFKPLR